MEWISVSDRLPEVVLVLSGKSGYSDDVLVFIDGDVKIAHLWKSSRDKIKWVIHQPDESWDVPEQITHWMPLPQPPKED